MGFEGAFDGEGGFAFAFEVFGEVGLESCERLVYCDIAWYGLRFWGRSRRKRKTHNTRPSSVGSAFRSSLDHHI